MTLTEADACPSGYTALTASDPVLPLVLTWLRLPELAGAASVCCCWHASQLEVLAAAHQMVAGDMPTLFLSNCMDVSDVRFGAECAPVHASAPNPLLVFDSRVRRGCMAGGDMRVSRVERQQFDKFSHAELAAMIALPKQAAHGQSTAKWDDIDIGWKFWATVVSAIRAAAWHHAEGAQWTWTERRCRGNQAELLICKRITWVFSRPAGDGDELKHAASIGAQEGASPSGSKEALSGSKEALGLAETALDSLGHISNAQHGMLDESQRNCWSISVRAEQHLQLLR
mmetsp:Transcript_33022/g.60904  ORF Transcript_33022/g.60904 Transcript_33022/m.60904 type:complete len:285 (+) Transcript_33022:115-969(+)